MLQFVLQFSTTDSHSAMYILLTRKSSVHRFLPNILYMIHSSNFSFKKCVCVCVCVRGGGMKGGSGWGAFFLNDMCNIAFGLFDNKLKKLI